MHILLVADGRSATARSWIQALLANGERVSLVSTYPSPPVAGVDSLYTLPVAFGSTSGASNVSATHPKRSKIRSLLSRSRLAFLAARYWLGPLSMPFYAHRFKKIIKETSPDLVQALRIPFEGMLAAATPAHIPFALSIWGNDLTLHANGSALMRASTLSTLRRADALLADAQRDLRLARVWGFAAPKPALLVPGGGGIDLAEMERIRSNPFDLFANILPAGGPLVVNPRGIRPAYVRNDVFFQALPLVLERYPNVSFVCPAMAGQTDALRWIQRLKLEGKVRLLQHLPQTHLWDLFIRSEVTVSISEHDGTPNTLLEAMACSCFPIAGDIESLREWITPGVNGLLVEPGKPQSLAEGLLLALENPQLRRSAAQVNLQLIRERAEVNAARVKIKTFFKQLVD